MIYLYPFPACKKNLRAVLRYWSRVSSVHPSSFLLAAKHSRIYLVSSISVDNSVHSLTSCIPWRAPLTAPSSICRRMVSITGDIAHIILFITCSFISLSVIYFYLLFPKSFHYTNFICPKFPSDIRMFPVLLVTHSSGRFALTKAAGIGGQTALPQRLTCSARG